jgi:cytosine/adenosine deaminase-related metal-dependent hydrolase
MRALHIRGTILPDGVARDLFVVGDLISFAESDAAETISDGGWITPGLVDAHAHLAMAPPGAPGSVEEAIRAAIKALVGLALLVREPGSPAGHAADDLGAGLPRTITAGNFLAPPGRYFPGLAREVAEASLPAAAAEEAREGGWVKIVGDFLDDMGRVTPTWSPAALADAAEAAHQAGARITMHATIPNRSSARSRRASMRSSTATAPRKTTSARWPSPGSRWCRPC